MSEIDTQLKALFPIAVDVQASKTYVWCGCGESKEPPMCDKHACEKALQYIAQFTETLMFCNCKQSNEAPLCDGSHAKLVVEYLNNRKNNAT